MVSKIFVPAESCCWFSNEISCSHLGGIKIAAVPRPVIPSPFPILRSMAICRDAGALAAAMNSDAVYSSGRRVRKRTWISSSRVVRAAYRSGSTCELATNWEPSAEKRVFYEQVRTVKSFFCVSGTILLEVPEWPKGLEKFGWCLERYLRTTGRVVD
jgi:hypothetical protein